MNDMLPALLSLRCEPPRARLFAARTRGDGVCTVVPLCGQHSTSLPEKPIASSTLDRRWDICDPG